MNVAPDPHSDLAAVTPAVQHYSKAMHYLRSLGKLSGLGDPGSHRGDWVAVLSQLPVEGPPET